MDSRLDLNTDSLKEKNESYSSLTDVNYLQLFTDDYELMIKAVERKEKDRASSLIEGCFTGIDNNTAEKQLIENMFLENSQIVLQTQNVTERYGNYYVLLGSILVGLLISMLIFGITGKKGKKENVDNTYNPAK